MMAPGKMHIVFVHSDGFVVKDSFLLPAKMPPPLDLQQERQEEAETHTRARAHNSAHGSAVHSPRPCGGGG